jgi:hypothetical protein
MRPLKKGRIKQILDLSNINQKTTILTHLQKNRPAGFNIYKHLPGILKIKS